ncbi:replicative helicase loader/inhibitor [Bacillus sp. B15-48]|uniref:replicative helicase loader/inhibitor n=1 Tax=Bacillus sp. B15-48 TaxID=1548601 RepID=UPI0019401775|nr:replicative helicase loader/inhibitor [Bacillus sp. B15-48]MBM4764572.1 hypothetical protein [Bacillus sp. B15-48]
MEKHEVLKILEQIQSMYPNFKISDETLLIWINMCRKMEYSQVNNRLMAHIAKSPFPPVIAEIAVYRKEENDFLNQLKQWESEGRERIERDQLSGRSKPEPCWLLNSSPRRLASS